MLLKIYRALFINTLFFYLLGGIIVLFGFSYFFPSMYFVTWGLLVSLVVATVVDCIILFSQKNALFARRSTPERFSNGDENEISIQLQNNYPFKVSFQIIDEIPFQFQERNFLLKETLGANKQKNIKYALTPFTRGEYEFGGLNIFISSPLGLIGKKYIFSTNSTVATYPSFLQINKYDFLAFSNNLSQIGLKKLRRIGNALEFEQIKEYVQGENIRNINWKATAKKNALMINQFQDEKSQPVYCFIDKGRTMKMPFNQLSLLDYAINSTLILSNIILKKQDKVGMLTFSNTIENRIAADRKGSQMNQIMESLYNVQTDFKESDFNRLYMEVKYKINQRSLILLYTNFETLEGLYRQLPYLKAIAKMHMLIVVFFENTELNQFVKTKVNTTPEIFDQTIAQKFIYEKKLIVRELKKYGIHSLLSKPENLTVDSINKYLEMKARGLI